MKKLTEIDFSHFEKTLYQSWKEQHDCEVDFSGLKMSPLVDRPSEYPFDVVKAWFHQRPKIGLADLNHEFLVTEAIDFTTDLSRKKEFYSDISLHLKGASAAQEIAFLVDRAIQERNDRPSFQVSITSEFFYSLAKVRALSFVWWRVLEEKGLDPFKEVPQIQVVSSLKEQSLLEVENNILRNFNTSLVGVISGVDEIVALPHTFIAKVKQEEKKRAQRIARNMTLMSIEESYLNRSPNAISGSSLIEELTASLVKKAWALLENFDARALVFDNKEKSQIGVHQFVKEELKPYPAQDLSLFQRGQDEL